MMTTVRLKDVHPRLPELSLDRLPIFLRFVISDDDPKTLDALNEVEDYPRNGEVLIPARMDGEVGRMHVCRRGPGQRCEWKQWAEYKPVECPLTQEQLADYGQWCAWVDFEVAKEKEKRS